MKLLNNISRDEFYSLVKLAALQCQDYLDEINPYDTRVMTKKNLFETLVIMYEIEKGDIDQ